MDQLFEYLFTLLLRWLLQIMHIWHSWTAVGILMPVLMLEGGYGRDRARQLRRTCWPLGHWYMGQYPWGKAERQWPSFITPVAVGSSVPLQPLDLSPPQPHAVPCFCQHSGLVTAQNIFPPILLRAAHSLRIAAGSIFLCSAYQEAAGFPSCQASFFRTCISS